jgi:hypothetical protein
MAVTSADLPQPHGRTVPVRFNSDVCKVVIEREVYFERAGTFSGAASDSAFAAMILRIVRAVGRFYNRRFELAVTATTPEIRCPCRTISIEVRLKVSRQGQGYKITLIGGGTGGSSSGASDATIQEHDRPGAAAEAETYTYVHEVGHLLLGLPDEYAGNNHGSPVHNDGSIMGNYHDRTQPKPPEAKERHFEAVRAWVESLLPPTCRVTLQRRI